MNKQKKKIAWCVLGIIVLQETLKFKYYSHLISGDIHLTDASSVLNLAGVMTALLLNCFVLVLAIRSLSNIDAAAKDRAYAILRFLFVMKVIMIFPVTVLRTVIFSARMSGIGQILLFYFRNLAEIALAVLLIIYKPEKRVEKVNLQEYDYVTFTSAGHRFAHYLLDMLFLAPFWLFMLQNILFARVFWQNEYAVHYVELAMQIMMFTSYLAYCFISEAIFRQTLGKMATGSAVVSDGVSLSTGRIFLRTLARLIPFDSLSFLFGAKWHDRASSTAVVYIDSWEKAFADNPSRQ
ncbi:RDD family protein [Longitalea arenae]|uniref:RDD family protein n=1 Tax=Longitalea arenae TaxID=2812558 RepID=UPI001967F5C3|nr:RDD family protein [Longitalea arenae]